MSGIRYRLNRPPIDDSMEPSGCFHTFDVSVDSPVSMAQLDLEEPQEGISSSPVIMYGALQDGEDDYLGQLRANILAHQAPLGDNIRVDLDADLSLRFDTPPEDVPSFSSHADDDVDSYLVSRHGEDDVQSSAAERRDEDEGRSSFAEKQDEDDVHSSVAAREDEDDVQLSVTTRPRRELQSRNERIRALMDSSDEEEGPSSSRPLAIGILRSDHTSIPKQRVALVNLNLAFHQLLKVIQKRRMTEEEIERQGKEVGALVNKTLNIVKQNRPHPYKLSHWHNCGGYFVDLPLAYYQHIRPKIVQTGWIQCENERQVLQRYVDWARKDITEGQLRVEITKFQKQEKKLEGKKALAWKGKGGSLGD